MYVPTPENHKTEGMSTYIQQIQRCLGISSLYYLIKIMGEKTNLQLHDQTSKPIQITHQATIMISGQLHYHRINFYLVDLNELSSIWSLDSSMFCHWVNSIFINRIHQVAYACLHINDTWLHGTENHCHCNGFWKSRDHSLFYV